MEFITVSDFNDFQETIKKNNAAIFYFSHEKCNVCKVLKPKVQELVSSDFIKIKLFYVDIYKNPDIAAQNGILTAPTLLFFAEGKENLRLGRHFGIDELKEKLKRPYELMYNN